MKKVYEKPEVEMLDFKLSGSIMAGEEGGIGDVITGVDESVENSPF